MSQKQKRILVGSGLALAILILAFYALDLNVVVRKKGGSLGVGTEQFNLVDSLSIVATTTNSQLPVLMVARNYNRIYTICENPPSNSTNVALYVGNFSDPSAASSSVNMASSTVVLAPGGSYELLPENMLINDIWATSTVRGVKLTCASQ